MPAEDRLQIEWFEWLQKFIRVQRTIFYRRTHGKVGQDDRRALFAKVEQCLIRPAKSMRLNSRVFKTESFGRIQRNELPAAMFKRVIDLLAENFVIAVARHCRAVLH